MYKITEKTLVPIGLVIILFGGVAWLTTLYVKAENTAEAVEKIQIKQDGYEKNISGVKESLARIEERVNEIKSDIRIRKEFARSANRN